MGFSITWTAVRGKGGEAVLAELELRPAGGKIDSAYRQTPFCGGELGGGWFIALASATEHDGRRFLDETGKAAPFLASLSRGCEVVAGFVEEHVMYSRSASWADGRRLWSVAHSAETGLDHLAIEGDPPPDLARVEAAGRAERAADPEGADYLFDVPLDLAKAVCAFRHDEGDYEFDVLEPAQSAEAPPARRSLWRRLLGR